MVRDPNSPITMRSILRKRNLALGRRKDTSPVCNAKEVRFVDEYLVCFSYAEACRRATKRDWAKPNSANQRGYLMAQKPRVRKLIKRRLALLTKKCGVGLQELLLLLKRNQQEAYDAGDLKESTRCIELMGKTIDMFAADTQVNLAVVPLGPCEIIKTYPQENLKCLENGNNSSSQPGRQ